jgi:hypothetical protein
MARIVIREPSSAGKPGFPLGRPSKALIGGGNDTSELDQRLNKLVRITRRNGVEAMADEGLKPGERVVRHPSDALKDGARITVRAGRNS